ncbi:MAG: BACON domain-containing protein [Muribaculaceae bacterium]
MKKLLSIFSIAVMLFAFSSCENEEGHGYEIADNIQIVSNNISFDANAQSGTVEVIAPGAVTVKCDAPWVTTSVDGSLINVTVTRNLSLEGRNAVLTIMSGNEKKNITVAQRGYVFDLDFGGATELKLGDAAFSKAYPCKSTLDLEISTSASWLTAVYSDGKLTISAEENNTGNPRKGYIIYSFGPGTEEQTVTVMQCEKSDMYGDYYFAFNDGSTGALQYFPSTITGVNSDGEAGLFLQFNISSTAVMTLPLGWDDTNKVINITNAQFMGMYGSTYYMHNIVWDETTGYINYGVYNFQDAAVDVLDDGTVYAEIVDNGTWGSNTASSMMLYAFSGTPAEKDNKVGSLARMVYPFLQKMQVEAAASPKAVSRDGKRMRQATISEADLVTYDPNLKW